MNCERFHNLMFEYTDGTLRQAHRAEVDAHLETCASCRTALAEERAFAGHVRQAFEREAARLKVSPHLHLKVKAALAVKPVTLLGTIARIFMNRRKTFLKVAVAASIVVVLAFLGLSSFPPLLMRQYGHEVPRPFSAPESSSTPAQAGRQVGYVVPQTYSPPAPHRMPGQAGQIALSLGSGVSKAVGDSVQSAPRLDAVRPQSAPFNTENYNLIVENQFLESKNNPLSTFSIDVDTAAYANMRRFIIAGQKPPKDAVRIEELINYFSYEYPQPAGEHPFTVTTEAAQCPWNKEHTLVLIGLQSKRIPVETLPPNNLVFLLDVSGSMDEPEKLPLLQSAFKMLTRQLRPVDRVAIVVYAGNAGLVLDSTAGDRKDSILAAIEKLEAGGTTAGGEGVQLAYTIAKQNFLKGGNNRVILATDGDFNVGASSDAELVRMIEEKRKEGIYLSVLGFGTGNLKDSRMEQLADKGNGNYAYIDNILEAKKVLVNELGATLLTVAKDVKLQIEFNPATVKAYRLIGYENRLLAKEDFNDDTKDAGEMGAGHSVTALYELMPADSTQTVSRVDDLKYQASTVKPSSELMTVKIRYKKPDSDTSTLLTKVLDAPATTATSMSENLGFAGAVAEFGMLLRDAQFKGAASYEDVLARAKAAKGKDDNGNRAEFIRIVEQAELLK